MQNVLNDGLRTKDILSKGMKEVSTSEMGNAIISKLKNIDLSFKGILRLKEKNQDYFNRVQIYQHFKNNTNDNGIYVYSFSVNPKEFQPSGTCNFSKLNLIY